MDTERSSGEWRWWRSAGAVALLLMLGAPGSTVRGQNPWPFQLEWTQAGEPDSYQLCVNGDQCSVLQAVRIDGALWRAALPILPEGEYRLVVQACGLDGCVAGTPELTIRIVPPAGRRPPIEVVAGPRISVGR